MQWYVIFTFQVFFIFLYPSFIKCESESIPEPESNQTLPASTPAVKITVAEKHENGSSNAGNSTESMIGKVPWANPMLNTDALKRATYVILAFTLIVILYFVIRAIRLRGNTKARRYKVLSRKGDTEMEPLDQSDDEEDSTIFEANNTFIGNGNNK